MARRTTRRLNPATLDRLLEELGNCRKAAIAVSTEAPIGGAEYVAAEKLRVALDDMAGTLTGNREHFWTAAHSSSGPRG